jgi:uncharacterized protein (DUF169 family)
MSRLIRFAEAIDKYVGLSTYPVAVKLLKTEAGLPINVKRPHNDFGQPIIPCQGSGLARRKGYSIAMLENDFSIDCPVSLILFGIVKPPQYWLDGNHNYQTTAETREAAINQVDALFRFKHKEYRGVVFSPLRAASYNPDVILAYCNSMQALHLVRAARYEDGRPLTPHIMASAVCSTSVVQTVQTGRCQLSIPCGGDRSRAFAKDDELVFSIPYTKLDSMIKGLETIADVNAPSDPILQIRLGIKTPYSRRSEKLKTLIAQEKQRVS